MDTQLKDELLGAGIPTWIFLTPILHPLLFFSIIAKVYELF